MILYTKISDKRKAEYRIITTLESDGNKYYIKKKALDKEANPHIQSIYKNYIILSRIYGSSSVAKCDLIDESTVIIEYLKGPTLLEHVSKYIKKSQWEQVFDELKKYQNKYLREYECCSISLLNPYHDDRNSNIDLTLDNIIITNNGQKIIDYEWLYPNIEPLYVMYRTILGMAEKNKLALDDGNIKDLLYQFNISDDKIADYKINESEFHDSVFLESTYHNTEKRIQNLVELKKNVMNNNQILMKNNQMLKEEIIALKMQLKEVSFELDDIRQKRWFRIINRLMDII